MLAERCRLLELAAQPAQKADLSCFHDWSNCVIQGFCAVAPLRFSATSGRFVESRVWIFDRRANRKWGAPRTAAGAQMPPLGVPMHSESGQTYARALQTMREVVEALRDEPDPDGVVTSLIERIERERAWVAVEMCLGLPVQTPPPRWLVRKARPEAIHGRGR